MKNVVWVYWENPKGVHQEPPYITLCRWTMLHRLRDSALVVVTPQNLDAYLPGMSNRLRHVQAFAFGRLHKFQRLLRGDPRSLAIKCDVIRAHLLRRYGGIYIDSDALLLDDLTRYFQLLQTRQFFIARRESHGKRHVSVNFYGARAESPVIQAYTDAQMRQIDANEEFDFTALGDVTLNPIVERLEESVEFIPEREVQPVTYEEAETTLLSQRLNVDDVLSGNEAVVMLFKGIFQNQLKDWSIDKLYAGDILLSKIIRRALPEAVFSNMRSEFAA